MVHIRPALAVTAALSLAVAAVPALGATSSTSSQPTGAATSALTLVDLSLANHSAQLGQVAGQATDVGSRVAKLVVTPATVDGTAHGATTVDPSNAPANVPSSAAPTLSLPAGLGTVTGPQFSLDAKAGPTAVLTSAILKAIGSIDLKPAGLVDLPLNLQTASLTNLAKVTSTQSEATKSATIGNISMPSLLNLLKDLGVNVPTLLDSLSQTALDQLNSIVSADALTALNAAVDAAQAKLSAVPGTLSAANSALSTATSALSSANTALANANTALTAANDAWNTAFGAINPALLPAGVSSTLTPAGFEALSPALQTSVDALSPAGLAALASDAVSAANAQAAAAAAQQAAQTLVDNLNALIDALQNLIAAVSSALTGNTAPLFSLGNITAATSAVASENSPAPTASVKVGSIDVLGTAQSLSQAISSLAGIGNTLTGVLNTVGAKLTLPSISLGKPSTSRSTSGSTRNATAAITALTINLPSLSIPTALSSVTAGIPGVVSITNGVVDVLGGSVKLLNLAETAQFTPGSAPSGSTPGSPSSPSSPSTPTSTSHTPSLAKTGLDRGVPMLAALLVLGSLAVMHRRRRLTAEL